MKKKLKTIRIPADIKDIIARHSKETGISEVKILEKLLSGKININELK